MRLPAVLLAPLAALLLNPGALQASDPSSAITVMTQNMDSGTDLGFMFQYASTNPVLGVDLTFAEVVASRVRERAALLASQIAAKQPDIIGLQEATLYSIGPTPATATFPLYDQLKLLLNSLNARGLSYTVVAVNVLSDIALPMTLGALRYTDRDAVLARAGANLQISNVTVNQYKSAFQISGITVLRGFISADVTKGGKTVRFATTHLESPNNEAMAAVQVSQAGELIAALSTAQTPVIVAGDFNSNAGPTPNDHTATVPDFLAAGYTDAWAAANPSAYGFTVPLYFEDPRRPNPSGPFERIDLIWAKGIAVDEIGPLQLVGLNGPPFASDHTGVIGRFGLE